ncbi:MAG: AMP-binding protein [Desulfobacteraceae bacterium]|jgi:amino acid adenylation domain-containing protein
MNNLVYTHLQRQSVENGSCEAVCMNDQRLSYADLSYGALSLSSYLYELKNFEVQECIGLFMPKSPMTVVAIYGVLTAGAAYVPIDIQSPTSRLCHIMQDCKIKTIITTAKHTDRIVQLNSLLSHKPQIVVLPETLEDHSWQAQRSQFKSFNPMVRNNPVHSPPRLDVLPESLAAVLYTSGSSGVPKGVMISHSAITTFTVWAASHFDLMPSDRFISHAPFHFDLSLFDLFAAHQAGGTTVLIPNGLSGNPKAVANLILQQKITIWQSVPSVLTLLAKYGDLVPGNTHMRHVLFAGEQMPVETLKKLINIFTSATFHNVYGATETNDTFIYSIPNEEKQLPDPLPIGLPLPYVDFKIVGNKHIAVNDEQEGELYVRAPTMMKGYRNQKNDAMCQLAADVDTSLKHNYYRTRDIVKMLPDGNLLFCGRNDDIIKTNGYRVNLLEVERCLQSHNHLKQVAVIALPDPILGHKILAIVVPQAQVHVSVIGLKRFCAEKLAKYAIPHIFDIHQSSLPTTSSGKIDKKQLKERICN